MSKLLVFALLFVFSALADDPSVLVVKGRRFTQSDSSGAVPVQDGTAFFFQAGAIGLDVFEPVANPQVTTPGNQMHPLQKVQTGFYRFESNFATQAALEAGFPLGTYQFSATLNFLGATSAHSDLTSGSFPTAPKIENFSEVQTFDPAADVDLRWNSFADATANDLIALEVTDTATGSQVADEREIDPSTSEWIVSQGSFESGQRYKVSLTFIHLLSESTPTASELIVGKAYEASQTTFEIVASGPAAGGGDKTPPALSAVNPAANTLLSSPLSPILFQFSEPMDAAKTAITWVALLNGAPQPLDASKFNYLWSDDGLALAVSYAVPGAGWTPGLVVTWTLNAQSGAQNNFRDKAGNELPFSTGTFVTAGGADPCSSPVESGVPGSVFGFFKQVNYLQSSADAPVQDPDLGAQAFAFIQLPSSTPVQTIATLKVPTDNPFAFHLKVLTPPRGAVGLNLRFAQEQFATRSDLDTAYPAGTYFMELRNSGAQTTNSSTLTVPSTGYPPTPHDANYSACQSIAAASDFTVQWDPFTGAGTNAMISFTVSDSDGTVVFHAPDPCHHVTLDSAATGIVIPAGTLASNTTYTAELTFSRLTDSGKTLNEVAGTGFAALTRITRFPLQTTGTAVTLSAPRFESVVSSGAGQIQVTLNCMPNRPLVLEAAPAIGAVFSPALTTNPPSNKVTLTLPAQNGGIFRAQQK